MRSTAQPLGQAITQLATQTGVLIGVAANLIAGKQAPELNGRYTPEQALIHLLTGSGLVAVEIAPGRYSVMPAQEAGKPAGDVEGKPAGRAAHLFGLGYSAILMLSLVNSPR